MLLQNLRQPEYLDQSSNFSTSANSNWLLIPIQIDIDYFIKWDDMEFLINNVISTWHIQLFTFN